VVKQGKHITAVNASLLSDRAPASVVMDSKSLSVMLDILLFANI
jgi:hypothetical protein